jgi:hypothetical protein
MAAAAASLFLSAWFFSPGRVFLHTGKGSAPLSLSIVNSLAGNVKLCGNLAEGQVFWQ